MSGRWLPVLLAAALGACAGADIAVNRRFDFSSVKRVAVVAFPDASRAAGSGDLVTAAFEQALLRAGYDVVERGQVAKVLRDLKFSGALDARVAAAAGRALGVDAFVQGRLTQLVAPRETVVNTTVETDQTTPVFGRRRRVQRPDGTWTDVTDVGYKTSRTYVKKPTPLDVGGKLGVSARLVSAPTGAMLWSGSETLETQSLDDAARAIADDILKAVKSTWPAELKK